MTTLTTLGSPSSYTIIPPSTEVPQMCTHNQKEASTEFMVTSTTVENVGDTTSDVLDVTEREIVQQSSTIIPCVDHGDKLRGPQPIIAVIPPPETTSHLQSDSVQSRTRLENGLSNDSNLVSCSSIATILSHSSNNTGKGVKYSSLFDMGAVKLLLLK